MEYTKNVLNANPGFRAKLVDLYVENNKYFLQALRPFFLVSFLNDATPFPIARLDGSIDRTAVDSFKAFSSLIQLPNVQGWDIDMSALELPAGRYYFPAMSEGLVHQNPVLVDQDASINHNASDYFQWRFKVSQHGNVVNYDWLPAGLQVRIQNGAIGYDETREYDGADDRASFLNWLHQWVGVELYTQNDGQPQSPDYALLGGYNNGFDMTDGATQAIGIGWGQLPFNGFTDVDFWNNLEIELLPQPSAPLPRQFALILEKI